ncbi:hypothetical protein DFH09DRAFT_1086876 [Mycena vulgaris]|nr:hypothetical protein DFH09DRAFT_1086876 [Mycena vulgaris]
MAWGVWPCAFFVGVCSAARRGSSIHGSVPSPRCRHRRGRKRGGGGGSRAASSSEEEESRSSDDRILLTHECDPGSVQAINLMARVEAGRARTHKHNNTDASRLNSKHVRNTGDYINTILGKTGKGQGTLDTHV